MGAIILSTHKVVVQIKQTNPCKALRAWPGLNCWLDLHFMGGERKGAWKSIPGGRVNLIRSCSHVTTGLFGSWSPQGNPSKLSKKTYLPHLIWPSLPFLPFFLSVNEEKVCQTFPRAILSPFHFLPPTKSDSFGPESQKSHKNITIQGPSPPTSFGLWRTWFHVQGLGDK